MMAINGRIQRESDVVHLVAQQLFDLSGDLSGLAGRDGDFKLPTGRGDEFAHGSPGSPDSREKASAPKPRDIFIPDLHIDTLKVKSRNFHQPVPRQRETFAMRQTMTDLGPKAESRLLAR